MKTNEEKAKRLLEHVKDPSLASLDMAEALQEINETLSGVKQAVENIKPAEIPPLNLENIELIKGLKGDKGDKGQDGLSVKGDKGEPGKDGKDSNVPGPKGDKGGDGYVPIKGIDFFDGEKGEPGKDGSPDTGEQIIKKINETSTEDEDLKIDASHVKNLPKEVQKHTFTVQRNIAWFDETTLVIDNPTKIKLQGAGVQASIDSEGSLIITVVGGTSTFVDETMTDSGDHTIFTISHTPSSGTLLVINENTGQAVPTSSYTNTTTNVVFGSSQQVGSETPVFRARYSY